MFTSDNEGYTMRDFQRSERVDMGQSRMEASGCVKPVVGLITQ